MQATVKISYSNHRGESAGGADYTPPRQYWEAYQYIPVQAALDITYRDYRGETTRRTIHVNGYDGSSYLDAFCDSRQANRTFRIERIQECIDTETGELVTDVPTHLLEKYRSSPEYILGETVDKLADVLLVLYYVGKADGQLRAAERDILRAVVRKVAADDRITDQMIDRRLNGATVPSLQAVKLAINRICKANQRNMVVTYKVAEKIVNTQKTVHPSETEILEYMARKMAKEGIEA